MSINPTPVTHHIPSPTRIHTSLASRISSSSSLIPHSLLTTDRACYTLRRDRSLLCSALLIHTYYYRINWKYVTAPRSLGPG
jgi:hypothetical protein